MTKQTLKKLSYIFGLIVLIALIKLPYKYLGEKISDTIKDQAQKNNIALEIKSSKLDFPLILRLEKVSALIPTKQLIIPAQLDELTSKLSLSSLFLFTKDLSLRSNLYRGTVEANIKQGFFSKDFNGDLKITNLSLEEYPLSKSFNLSGSISAEAKTEDHKSEFKLNISDANYLGEHKLYELVRLPKVYQMELKLIGRHEENAIEIESFDFSSSVGKISGTGIFKLDAQGFIAEANSTLEIELTDSGVEAFAGYLALAAGEDVEARLKNWQVDFSVEHGKPIVKVRKS